MLDLGVHLIDLALWLRDYPPMALVSAHRYAKGRKLNGADDAIEDLAFAEFYQQDGTAVRIACSWNANIGRHASIGADIFGSRAGAVWRNVDGSFVDFQMDLLRGTSRESIGSDLDTWGPRALMQWLTRLSCDRSFDPEAAHILATARLIDEVYRS